MDTRRFIEALVTGVAPNAPVAGVEEHDARCRITRCADDVVAPLPNARG
ncbi:MAG: hypothetical protein FJ027_08610 [Candidatus Rokubacteria bacterium]|nr:hypothetical protein [Candidatus Rokubacteria bacterium]